MRVSFGFLVLAPMLSIGNDLAGQATETLEIGVEGVFSDDVNQGFATGAFRLSRDSSEFSVQFEHNYFSLDYTPNELSSGIGYATEVDETKNGFSLQYTQELNSKWESSISGYHFDGFPDYRTVWINEYYRQLFSGFETYVEAEPKSFGGGFSLKREIIPQNVFIDLSLNSGQEEIAPGYERVIGPGGGLVRDESILSIWGMSLGIEHLLSVRARARHEISWMDVTGRSTRVSYRGLLNWAVQNDLVLRSEASYTRESDEFYAWSVGSTIEKDWNERWYLGLTIRHYEDNGQLENSLFTVTSAAPALDTWRMTLSLRYTDDKVSAMIYAGPYYARYGRAGDDIAPFVNLYKDRDWFHTGMRLNYNF